MEEFNLDSEATMDIFEDTLATAGSSSNGSAVTSTDGGVSVPVIGPRPPRHK